MEQNFWHEMELNAVLDDLYFLKTTNISTTSVVHDEFHQTGESNGYFFDVFLEGCSFNEAPRMVEMKVEEFFVGDK